MNFLLTLKLTISYFSHMWKENLAHIYKVFSSSFSSASQAKCLSRYMCGNSFTRKFPPDFHNCIGLNGLVNFHQINWFYAANLVDLKKAKKTTTSCEKWFLGGVLQKSFSKKFLKIHREIPVRLSLSNNVKCFHDVRLATLSNKDRLTGVWGFQHATLL